MDQRSGLTNDGVGRRDFLRYSGIVAAAAGIGTSVAACGGGGSASTAGSGGGVPDTITATLAFTLSGGFDPMNASSAVATAINQHIFEGLIDLDPVTRAPYLALAKAQPVVSSDGLSWTAQIRDGAVFSDGTKVTADDVAWSFTRAMDPANKAIIAGFLSFLGSVTAKDASTVEFKLKTPFSGFTHRISVVKIVPRAKTGDAAAAKAFDTAPIGSGPFKLDKADSTSGAVISANDSYNGAHKAHVKKIVFNTTPDNTARLNDLKGGQSQAIEAVPFLDVSGIGSYQVDTKPAFNSLFLMFNCSAAPFNDKRVRQALHYGIDTSKVIATALSGYGSPATSYLDEGNAGYQKAATVYTYDPEKAKELLAAAGVSNLKFELVTTNTGFVADAAPLIIDSWKSIGVTATININPSSAVYGKLVPADGFRVLAASGDPTVYGDDVDLLLRWFYYGKTWPTTRERWTDASAAQCSQLIEQAAAATGTAQQGLWQNVLDLVADEVPLYPVFHLKTVTGSDATKLTGFHGAASTGLYFLDTGRKA